MASLADLDLLELVGYDGEGTLGLIFACFILGKIEAVLNRQ